MTIPDSNSIIEAIVIKNNEAVASLLQRNYNEAILKLHDGCNALRRLLTQENATHAVPDHSMLQMANMNQTRNIQSIPIYEMMEQKTNQISEGEDTFALFDRAFTIPIHTSASQRQPSPAVTKRMIAVVLFYNMALIHHNEGILNGNSKKLRSALQFYNLAYAIIYPVWDTIGIEDLSILLLGLWNNMGHIHSNLFNKEQTKLCVYWLQNTLHSIDFSKLMEECFWFEIINLFMTLDVDHVFSIAPAA